MMYHPHLAAIVSTPTVDLVGRYATLWPDRPLPRNRAGELHYERLVTELWDWSRQSGLARGQADFGALVWVNGISAQLRRKYGVVS